MAITLFDALIFLRLLLQFVLMQISLAVINSCSVICSASQMEEISVISG